MRAQTGPNCALKITRANIVTPCCATPVMRPSRSDQGKYLTPGRSARAETKETSARVSTMTTYRYPSSEATARVCAGL